LETLPDCASAPVAKRLMLATASRLSFQYMMASSTIRMVWLLVLSGTAATNRCPPVNI